MRTYGVKATAPLLLLTAATNLSLGYAFVSPALVRQTKQGTVCGSPLSVCDRESSSHNAVCPASRRSATQCFSSQPENSVSYGSIPVPSAGKKDLLASNDVASIDELVMRRADARRCGDYESADAIRGQIDTVTKSTFPPGYRIELKDIPRKIGGGTTWDVVPEVKDTIEWHPSGDDDGTSVLQLSHAAIGLATSAAERNVPVNRKELHDIVSKAIDRLEYTGATELRGRKAADAAFWFALAGVSDANSSNAALLFDSLARIAIEELQRFGLRASCRAKDIMHIVERLAAAGITGELSDNLHRVAADCLDEKGFKGRNTSTSADIVEMLRSGKFDMHSDRSLLWIWRFSIRQRKLRSFLRVAAKQYDRTSQVDDSDESLPLRVEDYVWENMFDDPTLPLIVDVGSGMGVSLHGLATLDGQSSSGIDVEWDQCNFVGVDLSRLAVGYAKGIACRWGITNRLQFCVGAAEDILLHIQRTYPGDVKLVMIQFPTPFRLQKAGGGDAADNNTVGYDKQDHDSEVPTKNTLGKGNTQLPKHPYSGFMVTRELLSCACETLKGSSAGKLLIQSNCEDVAIMMRSLAVDEAGFDCVNVPSVVASFDSKARLPQRTAEYIKMGGGRALGEGWSAESLLPRRGATETEIACFLERTPTHRCMFVPSGQPPHLP